MRHRNPISTSCLLFRHGKKVMKPYNSQYIDSYNNSGFKNANKKCRYVQILQYIADHDGCSRADINVGVFKFKSIECAKRYGRGYASLTYSQLLYLDLIDYDKSYKYHITSKGMEVLQKSYVNDNLKLIVDKV